MIQILGVLLGLLLLLVLLRELIECFSPKTTHNLDKTVYEILLSLISSGKKINQTNRNGKNPAFSKVVEGALWDVAEKGMRPFDPTTRIAKRVTKLAEEVATILDKALENAERLGSQEAFDYAHDCIEELQIITQQAHQIDDPEKTIEKINLIKEQAEQIAEAESFADSQNSDEPNSDELKPSINYWQVLELQSGASQAEIKEAYRDLAQLYHPDKCHHLGKELKKAAEDKLKEINEAYTALIKGN